MTERTPTAPGWYPDPLESGQERYWDGTWTGQTRPQMSAPAPASSETVAHPQGQQPAVGAVQTPSAIQATSSPETAERDWRRPASVSIAVVLTWLLAMWFLFLGISGVKEALGSPDSFYWIVSFIAISVGLMLVVGAHRLGRGSNVMRFLISAAMLLLIVVYGAAGLASGWNWDYLTVTIVGAAAATLVLMWNPKANAFFRR